MTLDSSNIISKLFPFLIHFLIDFCIPSDEWKTLWRFVGSSIKAKEVPAGSQIDGGDVLYPYEDFKLVCTACQELKLSIDEKRDSLSL